MNSFTFASSFQDATTLNPLADGSQPHPQTQPAPELAAPLETLATGLYRGRPYALRGRQAMLNANDQVQLRYRGSHYSR